MNTLNNETKHGANDTQLNKWSLYNINIENAKNKQSWTQNMCKSLKVYHKLMLFKEWEPIIKITVKHVLTNN